MKAERKDNGIENIKGQGLYMEDRHRGSNTRRQVAFSYGFMHTVYCIGCMAAIYIHTHHTFVYLL